MAKKVKFPLEMRNGVQVRTLEELQEHFDIEKVLGYLLDGKLNIWLEDRYYMAEAETIRGIDAYAIDAKEKLCSTLGVKLKFDAEIDVEEIERRKERLAKLKQYTDDEIIWTKVNQVAFNQEDLADLLDEDCKEIFLCANKFQVPYAIGNVTYRGIGNASVFINATEEIDLEKQKIQFKNIQILNSDIETAEQLYQKGLECLWARNGREYDKEKGLEYLKKSMEKGHLEAAGRFLDIISDDTYAMEKYGETILSIAAKNEEIVQKGGLYALRTKGVLYSLGIYYKKDRNKARKIVQEAADKGCSQAFVQLYYLVSENEEFQILQRGIQYQSAFCANKIGRGYEEGWWGLPIDKNKANKYFLMSIDFEENGEPTEEGYAYYNYALNCKDNVQRKISFLQKVVNDRYRHGDAAFELGWLYFNGNEIEKDYKKAYSYFELGNKFDNPASAFMLGRCIYEGKGAEKNLKIGFDKMFKGATKKAGVLGMAKDYAVQIIEEHINSEIELAYFGKDGYYYIVKETVSQSISFSFKDYMFYYISNDAIISGKWNPRKLGSWKMGMIEVHPYLTYIEQSIYIIVGDGEKGALFKIDDNSKNIYKINEFCQDIMNGIFLDFDEEAGILFYGSKGASELEYTYK